MNQAVRPIKQARKLFVCAAIAAAVLTFGCNKKPVAATAPSAPPPPPPSLPTVTLQAAPTSINKGETTTLSWSSTNATQLSISPTIGSVAPEGSTKVTPADSTTYTITASGPGGNADASVRVTVAAPAPTGNENVSSSLDELINREMQDVYFETDKADIRSDARTALQKDADFLRNYPQAKVTIEGHCDERGSTEYNLALGDRRANAVKQYLVSLGIPADRLSTVSYGKEKPFCTESNETCWAKNRRGHFVPAK